MAVSLDLRKAWKHQRHGDLLVVLTWVNDERALVLMSSTRKNAGWYIVQESAAWRWGVDHHDATMKREAMGHAVSQSHIACDMLNLEPSKMNRARVIDVITGWLPDLITMPTSPEKEFKSGSIGDMVLRADHVQIAGEPIRQEIEGQTYG